MQIRAKVQVHEKKVTHYNQGEVEVTFYAVHAGSEIPEALQYAKATPSGRITLLMVKSVADRFELGKYYNVDFTPIEE